MKMGFLYVFMQLIVFFLTIKDVYDAWQAGINQSIIKHTKSACLPIIESKSILDHNRKSLQALDDDLKWVLSKNINYIFNVAWC